MEHLKNLRLLNIAGALLMGASGLGFVLLMGIPGLLAILDGEAMGWVFLLTGLVVGAFFGAIAVVHGRVAGAVVHSRGRVAQTVLAVVHLMNFPLGTVYAVYALWLCFVHDPTKTSFDVHDRPLA